MGFLRVVFFLGFSFFIYADEMRLPKTFECVGWLIGVETLHQDQEELNQTHIATLEDLHDLDIKPLLEEAHYNYYYELVKQVEFNRVRRSEKKLVYYFEGYPVIEFLDNYLQTMIKSSWGIGTVTEQAEAALSGQKHKLEKMTLYSKLGFAGLLLYTATHWGLSTMGWADSSTLEKMEVGTPVLWFGFIVPFVQSFIDGHKYKKMKIKSDATIKDRAVALGKKLNLDLFSELVKDSVTDAPNRPWAKTVQVRGVKYKDIHEGILTVTYGQKENFGRYVPFLLLGVEYESD